MKQNSGVVQVLVHDTRVVNNNVLQFTITQTSS